MTCLFSEPPLHLSATHSVSYIRLFCTEPSVSYRFSDLFLLWATSSLSYPWIISSELLLPWAKSSLSSTSAKSSLSCFFSQPALLAAWFSPDVIPWTNASTTRINVPTPDAERQHIDICLSLGSLLIFFVASRPAGGAWIYGTSAGDMLSRSLSTFYISLKFHLSLLSCAI